MNRVGKIAVIGFVIGLGLSSRSAAQGASPPGADPDAQSPPDPKALIEEALFKIESGDWQEAVELARRARAVRPALDELKLLSGLLFVAQNRAIEAVRQLDDYNKTPVGRVDHRGFAALGRIQQMSRRYRPAARAYREAVRLAPKRDKGKAVRAEVLMDLATCELALNAGDDAIEHARRGRDMAPDDAAIQLRFVEILAAAAKQTEIGAAYDEASKVAELIQRDLRRDPLSREKLTLLQSASRLRANIAKVQADLDKQNAALVMKCAESLRALADVNHRVSLLDAHEYGIQALDLQQTPSSDWQMYLARIEVEIGGVDAVPSALEVVNRILAAEPNDRGAQSLKSWIEARAPRLPAP